MKKKRERGKINTHEGKAGKKGCKSPSAESCFLQKAVCLWRARAADVRALWWVSGEDAVKKGTGERRWWSFCAAAIKIETFFLVGYKFIFSRTCFANEL